MYDTLNLWLSFDELINYDLVNIMKKLSGITEHIKEGGQVYTSGYLSNYKVNISGQGVSLKGSLAKYFLPDNFHTLTRSDTKRAIEMMSDELSLPIQKAKIVRVDVANNLLMDFKPEAYYDFLGNCQYYKRLPQDKSLYYKNGLRQLVFYNKIAEAKAKRIEIPEVWQGQNVLRYEMRLISRLSNQLNQPTITASILSDEKFYIKIIDRWFVEYEAIKKQHSINYNIKNMKSPKDFKKQLELFAIKVLGQDRIMQDIENLRHQNVFDNPEYYSRLKREINELCRTPEMTEQSELMSELDKKIKSIKMNYR